MVSFTLDGVAWRVIAGQIGQACQLSRLHLSKVWNRNSLDHQTGLSHNAEDLKKEMSGLVRLLLSHLMMISNHPSTCARVIIPPTNYDLPPKMASLALSTCCIIGIWRVKNFLLAIVKSRFVPCLGWGTWINLCYLLGRAKIIEINENPKNKCLSNRWTALKEHFMSRIKQGIKIEDWRPDQIKL